MKKEKERKEETRGLIKSNKYSKKKETRNPWEERARRDKQIRDIFTVPNIYGGLYDYCSLRK